MRIILFHEKWAVQPSKHIPSVLILTDPPSQILMKGEGFPYAQHAFDWIVESLVATGSSVHIHREFMSYRLQDKIFHYAHDIPIQDCITHLNLLFAWSHRLADAMTELWNSMDGFVLGGGPHLLPSTHSRHGLHRHIARLVFEMAILIHAAEYHKVVLGICRGMQAMGFFSGSPVRSILIQSAQHHVLRFAQGQYILNTHPLWTQPDSLLQYVFGKYFARVYTGHEQYIHSAVSSASFTAFPSYHDHTIPEGIEFDQQAWVGIQFHPELTPTDLSTQKLFRWLIQKAKTT